MTLEIFRPTRSSWTKGEASPPDEPVTTTYVRDHTNLTADDALTMLESYITQAREIVESHLNRVLLLTSCTLKLSDFPALDDAVIELPGGRCQSVDSITYLDEDGAEQTWASSNYNVDTDDTFGNARVSLAIDAVWPATHSRNLPVTINYTAGWSNADAVPDAIKGAIAKVAATLYDERHAVTDNPVKSPWFRALIARWRIARAY